MAYGQGLGTELFGGRDFFEQVFGKLDAFVTGRSNFAADSTFLAIHTLLGIVFYFAFLQSPDFKSIGAIYLPVWLMSEIMLSFALMGSKKSVFSAVVIGKTKTTRSFLIKFGFGVAYGLTLALVLFHSGFSFLPFSITGASASTFQGVIAIGLIGTLAEEALIQMSLIPTFSDFLGKGGFLSAVFFIFGIEFLPLFQQYFIVSLASFMFALVFLFTPSLNTLVVETPLLRHGIALIFGAFTAAIFHVYSYAGPNLVANMAVAFAFFGSAAFFNWLFQSTLFSGGAHTAYDSFVYVFGLGIANGVVYAILTVMVYGLVMYIPLVAANFQKRLNPYSARSLNVIPA